MRSMLHRFIHFVSALLLLSGCGPLSRQGDGGRLDDDAGIPADDSGITAGDGGTRPTVDLAHPPFNKDAFVLPSGPIAIVPANFTLPVDGIHSNSYPFHAIQNNKDVTGYASWVVKTPALGSFNAATFHSAAGASGATEIDAIIGNDIGKTTLTLKVMTVIVAAGTPADAPNHFGGAVDPTKSPQIVYPPDGVLIPPNLNIVEFHFRPQGNDLFEIAFTGSGTNLRIYTKCNPVGNGCTFLPDEAVWNLISNAARNGTVTFTLRGTTLAGGPVGNSTEHRLSFAREDIQGGIYYWGASSGGIYRYDFGLRGQSAESYYNPQQAGGAMCVGCHAMARNGSRISVGLNIPGPATMRILDVATRTTLYELGGGFGLGKTGSNYEALTPDGAKIVTTEAGGLTLRDAANGTQIGTNPAVPNADMPDFSPDGTQIVFARGAASCQIGFCMTLSVMNSGIYSLPFTGNGFGNTVKTLVAPQNGANFYYPAYSPDGQYVVFNRAAGDSYDAKDAAVQVVGANGGKPVDLTALNTTLGNSWPKWAPFVHHFQASTLYWVTFTSRRPYGLRGGTNPQIWTAAVDTAKLAAGQDGSYPAFWLPFQEESTGNHIPQWVTTIQRAPCSQIDNSGCMAGEMCVEGVCQPGIM